MTEAPKADSPAAPEENPEAKQDTHENPEAKETNEENTEVKEDTPINPEPTENTGSDVIIGENEEGITPVIDVIFQIIQLGNSEAHTIDNKESAVVDDEFNKITISDKFPLLEKLLSIFKTENELNPLLAGYIDKVFSSLINKEKLKIWKYLQTYQENLDALIKRCADESVVNIMTKLMGASYGDSTNGTYIKQKQDMIKRLVEDPDETNIEGRFRILYELIQLNNEISYFFSDEIIDLLYQYASKNSSLGLKLISTLNDLYNTEKTKMASNVNESGKFVQIPRSSN